MATIGLLTELATQQGYGVPLDPSTGLVAEPVSLLKGQQNMFTDADYLGQFIQDTNTNEYFLINRGTATLSNLFVTDSGIALGTLNLGFNSDQIGAAKAYGTQVFGELAQKLVRGDPVGLIYLDGHSSGYSQSIAQYEALEALIQTEPVPGEFDFRSYYEQIKSRVRIFGVNGAGAPNSTLPAGSLDSIATNLILPGDIVDNAGQQYGIQITLDGAGNGYESFGLGALLGVAVKATPFGVALSAVAGGIAGAHSGSNAWEFMQKFPAFAAIDDTNLSGYSFADRKALVAVDAYSWQAMSDLDKSALLKHPEAVVQDLFVNGLTPSSIQMESQGGIRYTFNNGVSYLYQDTGGVKTYAFSQTGGDSVTVRVDSISTAYTFADNSSSIVYSNGDALFLMPDGSTLYQLADGRGQLQVNGTQYEFGASDQIRLNDQGQWQITSPTAQGAQIVLVNNDGTQNPPFIYDAAAQSADSLTLTQTIATATVTTIYQAGVYTQTVATTINGNTVNVTYTYDPVTGDPVPHVNTINGQPPTDQAAADSALRQSGVGPGQLVLGDSGAAGTSVGGIVSTFDAYHPTGTQTLAQAFATYAPTLIDALSLIKAIQSGDPLPVTVSGLRLANDLTSTPIYDAQGNFVRMEPASYSLQGAANVGSGILSLMSLDAALKRGDTLAAITAGAQTLGFGASAYLAFAQTNTALTSVETATDISNFFNGTSGPTGAPGAIAYLNIVNSIAHGDALGTAMGVLALNPATAPIAIAYTVFNMITSLFGDDTPPEAWGNAHAAWDGFNAVTSAAGGYGGLETATQTYNGVLSYLDQLAAQEQLINPGSPIGIVANRLPSLSYRNYTGYQITDIDPLTGEQRNPGVLYDLTGRPYNAPAGSVQASQSLSERMIRVALERGAVAPLWEVQTAALQTQMGDPMAGLTEEERAGRAGLLASQQPSTQPPQPPLSGGSQTFRPVALDLNGDGVQTTGSNRTAAFNVDDTGYLKETAWLDNNDGFLFLDRNLNGQIDGGSELFSNGVVALSERGLKGMRWIDSNYDGSLSALDPVWDELKVWQDADGDGATDAGEIKTLAGLGITSLNYAMGTFERNGQPSQLASPDLIADTEGTLTYAVPEGIIVQTSQGHTSLLATRIDDRSVIEANRDGVTGYEDTELIISAADLLANDTLAGLSGQDLSITGVSGFTHGSGFLDNNGFVHYTPQANYFGAASFNYSILASTGQTDTATVDITVQNVNDAPVATLDQHLRAIYGYDRKIVQSGGSGGPTIYGIGAPHYAPYTGYDELTRTNGTHNTIVAYDDSDGPNKATVVVTDPDDPAGSFTFAVSAQAQKGEGSVDANGNISYTNWYGPNMPGQQPDTRIGDSYGLNAYSTQPDPFTVRVTDPHGASDTVQVTTVHSGSYNPSLGSGGKKPISIDLGDDGFGFTDIDDSSIFFDVNGDGFKRRTAWPSAGDGLLAFDADGNGLIDNGGEIGFVGYLPDAQTDLGGLAAFDSNDDGIFSALDARWSKFGVWQDIDQDGATDAGEFKTLDELGIAAVNLTSDGQFQVIDGQTVHGIGSVTKADGSTLDLADVTLAYGDEVLVANADGSASVAVKPPFAPSGETVTGTAGKDIVRCSYALRVEAANDPMPLAA